jgi:hypothetical protein
MPFQPKDMKIVRRDFSHLCTVAEKRNVRIDETARPLLFGAAGYYTAAPTIGRSRSIVRQSAHGAWDDLLQAKQGEILLEADIWTWIRRWFPDPIQGEQVPIVIADWMDKMNL